MNDHKNQDRAQVNDDAEEAYNTNLTLGGDRAVGAPQGTNHIPHDIPASKGTQSMMFASSLRDDDLHLSASLPDVKDATGGRSGDAGRSSKFSQRVASGLKRAENSKVAIIQEEDSASLKTVSPLTEMSRKS